MTNPSTITDYTLSITCGLCNHHSMLEVANSYWLLEAMLQRMPYAREPESQRAREPDVITAVRAKGNNTYQIVLAL